MKSLKRLITVILAVAMIITSLGIVAFADSSFSDITDSRVDEAVAKLIVEEYLDPYGGVIALVILYAKLEPLADPNS